MSLRARLLLALMAISALTLAALALALLPPLQDRLRTQAGSALKSAVLLTRPLLQAELPLDPRSDPDKPLSDKAISILDTLAERTDARVLLYRSPPTVDGAPTYENGSGSNAIADVLEAWSSGYSVASTVDGELRLAVPIPATGASRAPTWILAVRQSGQQATRAAGVVVNAFVTAAAISLVVALIVGLLLSGRLTRRLVLLRRAALALASGAESAPPPPVDPARDEIGDLSRAFGAMHAGLVRQEEARRTFVATASHELRTPLTSIQGNLELLAEDLEDGALNAADARIQVAGAQAELRRLANLATELLDLSRLDAGVELRTEPVDLVEVARAVAAEFARRASDRRVLVEVAEPRGAVWASADPGAVARIARILIDNGLRFAPGGGFLRLVAEYAGEQAVLGVSDNGPGVPPSEQKRIFERYERGSETGGEGGFGLGLAIGRELARRMGGELALEPEPTDGGATFTLTLPIGMPG